MKNSILLGTVDDTVIPVSLTQAKANSNIEHSDTDAYLQLVLDAAVSEAESYTERSILKRAAKIIYGGFQEQLYINYGPVLEISSLKYYDASGELQTVAAENYAVLPQENGLSALLYFKWEAAPEVEAKNPFPVEINLVCGYANANAIPADIKKAILLIFSQHELFREDAPVSLDRSSKALLRPYRKY